MIGREPSPTTDPHSFGSAAALASIGLPNQHLRVVISSALDQLGLERPAAREAMSQL